MSAYPTEQRDIENEKDMGQARVIEAADRFERFGEYDPEPVYVGTFVEVLRERARWASRWDGQLMKAAANEIERLEAKITELEKR